MAWFDTFIDQNNAPAPTYTAGLEPFLPDSSQLNNSVPGQRYAAQIIDFNKFRGGREAEIGGPPRPTQGGIAPSVDYSTFHLPELENVLTQWARGQLTAPQVQQRFKLRGWSVDLRRGGSDIEAFDPSGKAHYLNP